MIFKDGFFVCKIMKMRFEDRKKKNYAQKKKKKKKRRIHGNKTRCEIEQRK